MCATWIFFRAESFLGATRVFSQLATLSTFHPNLPAPVVMVLLVGVVSHFVPERMYDAAGRGFVKMPALAQGLALTAVAVAVRRMEGAEAVPFVYFQF